MNIYRTKSEKETRALARTFARRLKGGDVLLLQGELGAGKTTFVKGLAEAFGIKEKIKSPTFVLMQVHRVAKGIEHRAKSRKQKTLRSKPYALCYLVHADAYRVKSAGELMEAGLADWVGRPDALLMVEWGEKIKPLLRGKKYLTIKFKHGAMLTERIIAVSALASESSYLKILERTKGAWVKEPWDKVRTHRHKIELAASAKRRSAR